MGSACCCLSVEEVEDYMNPNSSVYRNCMCLSCFIQNFLNVYTSLFRRGDMHSIPSSIQGATSMTSASSLDNSLSDMYRSPPRPMPYDADPRYFRSQREGLFSRREKGSGHSNDESEPLRSDADVDSESLNPGDKWSNSSHEVGSKEYCSKSSLKLSSARYTAGVGQIYNAGEDEDVCPTCLEEYTPENPKIMTKCNHHFHLGCIYEWMERSESCPVCGKVIIYSFFSFNGYSISMIKHMCIGITIIKFWFDFFKLSFASYDCTNKASLLFLYSLPCYLNFRNSLGFMPVYQVGLVLLTFTKSMCFLGLACGYFGRVLGLLLKLN